MGPPTPLGPKTPGGSGSKNPMNAAAVNQGPRSPVRTAPQSPAGSQPKSPLHTTFKPGSEGGLSGASEHWYESLTGSPIQRCMSPEALFCTGFCHERWEMEKKVNGGVANHVDVVCPFFSFWSFDWRLS